MDKRGPQPASNAEKQLDGMTSPGHAEIAALRAIVAATAGATGPAFFEQVVQRLAEAMGTKYAFIAEFLGEHQVRTLSFWKADHFEGETRWDLRGTPCEDVVAGNLCHHPTDVSKLFPSDEPLVQMGIESYLGAPLRDESGQTLGHLAVFDDRPMPKDERRAFIFQIFAERATAELLRQRAELRLHESEERLRDLFDEAPIAYVHEGLDSKFIRANRTALRTLGITEDEVGSTYGTSFIPDTPDAQRRLKEAFDSIGQGTDTAGVVLELRRKDNGKPLWIQWWSRPDPGGQYTRTMFIDITDRILMEQEQARLRAQNRYLHEEIRTGQGFDEIVGESPSLHKLLQSVRRVAPTESTVLIQGETGTGKELIARAIHERSTRSKAPFIKVNCAALPAGLVESEFFGHEKGAFTGAATSRRGRFELADGGTIFLDEVGEVSPDVQVKLLRVLQESEFERVGGSDTVRVNVRVIAATNRDLAADVAEQKFRADLFYRLSVFPLVVPPLRERATDIPILVRHLVGGLSRALGKTIDAIEPATMDRLLAYSWPGNIRELRNILERAVILADGPMLRITVAELAPRGANAAPIVTLEEAERRHILAALELTGGTIGGDKGAAKILGVPPSTLRSTMSRLGIKAP